MVFNSTTILHYLRTFLHDIDTNDSIEITTSFSENAFIIYFLFPHRSSNLIQPKLINDKDVIIHIFSSSFCSIQFSIDSEDKDEIVNNLNRFFQYSSLLRTNLCYDCGMLNLNTTANENKIQWKTNDISITLVYSKEIKPFQCIFINKGWFIEMSKSILALFPFLNYHMYFKDNCLLSDFTSHSIHTIIFTSKQTNLFENENELSNDTLLLLHYSIQKFLTNEISMKCRNKECQNELKLCELIGDCIENINENKPIDRELIENSFITPELFHPQIVQDIAFCGMTTRINAPSLQEIELND